MVDYREIIRLNSLKFSNVGIANSVAAHVTPFLKY